MAIKIIVVVLALGWATLLAVAHLGAGAAAPDAGQDVAATPLLVEEQKLSRSAALQTITQSHAQAEAMFGFLLPLDKVVRFDGVRIAIQFPVDPDLPAKAHPTALEYVMDGSLGYRSRSTVLHAEPDRGVRLYQITFESISDPAKSCLFILQTILPSAEGGVGGTAILMGPLCVIEHKGE